MATTQQSLYIVNHLGRDRFVWATNAAEARVEAEKPPASLVGLEEGSPAKVGAVAARSGGMETVRMAKGASSPSS
jgi:hypothetical protein